MSTVLSTTIVGGNVNLRSLPQPFELLLYHAYVSQFSADPEFPRREGDGNLLIWQYFPKKLHEIEKKMDREGGRGWCP